MNDLEGIDMTTEEALVSALTPKVVGKIELEPFSLMRQVISISLCRASNESFFNAVMTVWVCTLSPSEALKAHENVTEAQLRAFDWAEAQGYSILNYGPLLAAYARLNRELEASTRARLAEHSEDGSKNAGGRPLV